MLEINTCTLVKSWSSSFGLSFEATVNLTFDPLSALWLITLYSVVVPTAIINNLKLFTLEHLDL